MFWVKRNIYTNSMFNKKINAMFRVLLRLNAFDVAIEM